MNRRRIYFDGFLPPAKLNVRHQRLNQSTQLLEMYHKTYLSGLRYRPASTNRTTPPTFPFAFAPQNSRHMKLPVSPFLVPAIIEALQASDKYKHLVEIVPGEADSYCASYLSHYGGIVLTGDSDLLVHEIGINGSVSFFQDVEVLSKSDLWALQTQLFHAGSIIERLSLNTSYGIRALAFEITMDCHGSFPKLSKRATTLTAVNQHKAMYEDFVKEYLPININVVTPESALIKVSVVKTALQALDPRICEYILQYPYIMRCLGHSQSSSISQDSTKDINVFLPFLIDSPSRTNAWEMSTSVRELAYSCINLILPIEECRATVFEHGRQAKASRGREREILGAPVLPKVCAELTKFLHEIRAKNGGQSNVEFWTSMAFIQDTRWSESMDKVSLSKTVLAGLTLNPHGTPSEQSEWDWDKIHVMALVHGFYYSFRILKQMLSFVILILGRGPIPKSILQLNELIQDLPSLNSLGGFEKLEFMLSNLKERSPVGDLSPKDEPSVSATVNASQQKKKRKRDKSNLLPPANKKSANPFDVLGTDW